MLMPPIADDRIGAGLRSCNAGLRAKMADPFSFCATSQGINLALRASAPGTVGGSMTQESKSKTRSGRIDPILDALGWPKKHRHQQGAYRIEEYDTEEGPADYALCIDGRALGIIEAKKLTLGPQNVLTQAERYARGVTGNGSDFGGLHVPFLYSTTGEVIWFHDVRHPLNASRRAACFHTAAAFSEMLDRDFEDDCCKLQGTPSTHERLRPYQAKANAATEDAILRRKREMLLAMATGKTFTMVNLGKDERKNRVFRSNFGGAGVAPNY
jgi:type I restriction enzyme R subunit